MNYQKYLELVEKYRKNDDGIIEGINKYNETSGHTPLTVLVSANRHCRKEYLETLMKFRNIDLKLKSKNTEYKDMTALEIVQKRNMNNCVDILKMFE